MIAAVRKEALRPDPVEVFELRCWARAKLYAEGEIDLHTAVDELQASAEASGLGAQIGQDKAQAIMAAAFGAVRAAEAEPLGGDEYEGLLPSFALACRRTDAKRRSQGDSRSLREPAIESVGAATSTLQAAEYLIQQNDPERFRTWLAKHGERERAAIEQHLANNGGNRCRSHKSK